MAQDDISNCKVTDISTSWSCYSLRVCQLAPLKIDTASAAIILLSNNAHCVLFSLACKHANFVEHLNKYHGGMLCHRVHQMCEATSMCQAAMT